MPRSLILALTLVAWSLTGCGGSSSAPTLVVTTLVDALTPPEGETTLRSALADIPSGGVITFDASLDGGTIALTETGDEHSVLLGEVFSMDMVLRAWVFEGFLERDYGRSALYARKSVTIDASALPGGITLKWDGDGPGARILAIFGDLTMRNVTVTGGALTAEALTEGTQPWTLARGAGLAVWGRARLEGCTVHANAAVGDAVGSRDRGAFGGGIYADRVDLHDCVVSGNTVLGYGAAGGGVYSVGGVSSTEGSFVDRCAVTGNRVRGQHSYGGGVYSDGGGPGNLRTMTLTNSTLARNDVGDNPNIAQSTMTQFYYRGGGFYMSNGRLVMQGCTVVENQVRGEYYAFSGKPNVGGGGLAATIGNAHVAESMTVGHSIVAGNTVTTLDAGGGVLDDGPGDVFTGSLIDFFSTGYNMLGVFDASQILVPVPPWYSLARKHLPKVGDLLEVDLADVVDLTAVERHDVVVSRGTDDGAFAVLWYLPRGSAVDAVPASAYPVSNFFAEYSGTGNLLARVLEFIETEHAEALDADYGTLVGATFTEESQTWPSLSENADWISFWHTLEADVAAEYGPTGMDEGFFERFLAWLDDDSLDVSVVRSRPVSVLLLPLDQRRVLRPSGSAGDAGAVEL